MKQLPTVQPKGTWVQTDRKAHELWADLSVRQPRASALLHCLVSNMGFHNAIVISQKNLAKMINCTPRTIRNCVKVLSEENWIQVRQIGQSGTVNAYIVNNRVAWQGKRDNIKYSIFDAKLLISDDEQKELYESLDTEKLKQIPTVFKGENQLPTGEGLEPPSQPSFLGLEPDFPTRNVDPETGEILLIEDKKDEI